MKYDFDEIVDRKGTNSLKYDCAARRGAPEDAMPFWVADMDFRTLPDVTEALVKKAEHGIFGYSEPMDDYFITLKNWFSTRFGWEPDVDKWTLDVGVVHAICTLIQALTNEGDAVALFQPVYYPFSESVLDNRRKLVVSELKNTDGYYTMDLEDFEQKVVRENVKMLLLCSPHNPVGRVWKESELRALGEICLKHGVFVVADEIHADFVYEGRNVCYAALGKNFAENCAICTAPTKTFNLAGLHIANTYIQNDEKREKVRALLARQGYSQPNVMGIVACRTAYEKGSDWVEQLVTYLKGNIDFLAEYLKENIPEITFFKPQGTYLVWLNCRALAMTDEELHDFMLHRAKLWLDDGAIFGKCGSGYERINVACPRATLRKGLERLAEAVRNLRS